jgi:autotransporter-associated beta strand protein
MRNTRGSFVLEKSTRSSLNALRIAVAQVAQPAFIALSMIVFSCCGPAARAATPLTITSTTYTENFDEILTTELPGGWGLSDNRVAVGGGLNNYAGALTAVDASATTLTSGSTGQMYAFNSAGDKAVGLLQTGSWATQSYYFAFTNSTGSTITDLALGWDYEKYRSGSRSFTWSFSSSMDGTAFLPVTAGDQTYAADATNTVVTFSPPGVINKTGISINGLNIEAGQSYYLQWTLTGTGGSTNGQGLGIDNFSLTATAGTGPSTVSNWNPGTTANWNTSEINWLKSSSPSTYAEGDTANFGDAGVGLQNGSVVVAAGGVTPAAVNVSNTSGNYTFSGGPIGGAGALTKTGAGTLTLTANNTYSGGTKIFGGMVVVSSDAQLGATSGAVTIQGGTVQSAFTGNLQFDASRNFAGGAVTLDVAGTNSITFNGSFDTTGVLTLPSDGTVVLAGSTKSIGGITFTAPATLKAGTTGTDTVKVLGLIMANNTSGTATINGDVDLGGGTRAVTVVEGATLAITGKITNGTFVMHTGKGTIDAQGDNSGISGWTLGALNTAAGKLIIHDKGGLGSGTTGTTNFNSGTLEIATPLVGENAIPSTLNISFGAYDAFPAIITGADLELSGQFRTFKASGTHQTHVTINNNTLASGGMPAPTGSGASTGLLIDGTGKLTVATVFDYNLPITVDTATFEVNAAMSSPLATLSVTNGATLKGTGTTQGVTIDSTATLSPGSSIGTLSADSVILNGKLKIELDQLDPAKNDVLNVTNALTLNGAEINFSTVGSLTDSAFVFAHYGSLTGNPFSTITGLPAGYTIDYNYQSSNALALILANGILHGDWDRNGVINVADIKTMLKALTDLATYKTQFNVSDADLVTIGDFNSSGTITNGDIQGLLAFVSTQPGGGSISVVPEPSAILTALFGLVGCAGFVRMRRAHAVPKNS